VAFQKLLRVDDVPPGRTAFVCPGGRPVVLANYQGSIHALRGTCAHKGFPLQGAVLWDHLIDCPYHHFQYDIRTGENHFPRNVYPKDIPRLQEQLRPLPVYPVKIEEEWIWVDLDPA
jgi:3-phenylpropionate/trans-cinnamate dioxygenase ferredoxin component